jgi:aminoglycoside phosphotransferase family enzyme/predicted kinase
MTPDSTTPTATQAAIVAALRDPAAFGPDCRAVALIETHISCVLLTGRYAYKIKKAVDLGFLDFTTLAARRRFCDEELRLNRRLAPDIYLDVVAITGSAGAPVVGGAGPAIEYAVRMREFPQDALASRLLALGLLEATDIDALAARVAAFHAGVEVAPQDGPFGRPEEIERIALQNFAQIRPLLVDDGERAELDRLEAWTRREYAARTATLLERQRGGFVRECHGDLHLGNIARIDGVLTIFDCIEFNPAMRWIDVASEVAFTQMDLADRRRPDLAHRFLDAWLGLTGDYAGLAVLRYYLVYRAMVRAKVTRLRERQLGPGDALAAVLAEYRGYVELASSYTRPPPPALVITHGFSGCGKTTLTQALLEQTGAVRIRTDVERKRLLGTGVRAAGPGPIDAGIYARQATEATYRRVAALAAEAIGAGFTAIVDAAFLRRWQRDTLRAVAAQAGIPFVLIDIEAREATLRERVARRAREGRDASDADLAVLDFQLRTAEALAADERADALAWNGDDPVEPSRVRDWWARVAGRLGGAR